MCVQAQWSTVQTLMEMEMSVWVVDLVQCEVITAKELKGFESLNVAVRKAVSLCVKDNIQSFPPKISENIQIEMHYHY